MLLKTSWILMVPVWFMLILVLLIPAFFIVALTKKKKPTKRQSKGQPKGQSFGHPNQNTNSNAPIYYNYQPIKYLLTANEDDFYRVLLPIAREKKLVICPKVRIADIIEPQKGQNWKAAFNRIVCKHVDFLLCKEPLHPVLVIELDDKSHNRPDRQERDNFVNHAFKTANIPILHTRNADDLRKKIDDLLQPEKGMNNYDI